VKNVAMPEPTTPLAKTHVAAPAYAGAVESAWSLVRVGQIRKAAEELHRLLRPDSAAALSSRELALALLLQVELDLAVGEIAGATRHLAPLTSLVGPVEALTGALASGETAAAYGDHALARDHFLAAGAMPGADEVLVRPWWVGAVLAQVRTGRRREGADLAREQVARAEQAGEPFELAHGLRALATAASGHDTIGMLRRARELATLATAQRLAVQLDTDIAALTILSPGAPGSEIAPMLRAAETYAGQEGLWPLHTRVVGLLSRIGEPARPLAGRVLEVLTPAEQRVAKLASQELSNRQIATELGVSIKGVEWHLSRVYRKLGIASREALAVLLSDDGPDAG
jgi:DNA-binding CsgD family transcriptional regulator